MRVLILRPSISFLPEVDAYARVLSAHGHTVKISSAEDPVPDTSQVDLVYRFGGFLARRASHVPEIHEYSSASTGRAPHLKNAIKSRFSTRPVGRVFLNNSVRGQFHFEDSVPWITRDMGVDRRFLEVRDFRERSHDIVYVGSIEGRKRVEESLLRLAKKGLRVAVAGQADSVAIRKFKTAGISFAGRLPTHEIPGFLAQANYGLNFTPDVYPFNQQTSTKVLEYLTAGLTVISNSYPWIETHSRLIGYQYLDLRAFLSSSGCDLPTVSPLPLHVVAQFLWESVLARAEFVNFLTSTASSFS